MNIFAALKIYAGVWSIKTNMVDENGQPIPNPRNFTTEELSTIDSAVVVPSEYGNSVEFIRVGGGKSYIPLSRDSTLGVGDLVDLKKAKLLTLCKQGENDIVRVEI